MTGKRRRPPEYPREWLNCAHSNLVRAKTILPGAYLEDLCFDAQQAPEKAIKAIFVARGKKFAFTHDLERLLDGLDGNGVKIPKFVWQAIKLTPFAVAARYPDLMPPVTRRIHKTAVRMAAAVVRWAERNINDRA